MALHGGTIFLGENPSIVAEPTDGGDAATVVTQPSASIFGITTDRDHLYWLNQTTGGLLRANLGGEHIESLATGVRGTSRAPAVDEKFIYWLTNDGSIAKAPKGGGTMVTVSKASKGLGNVLVDSKNVYWIGSSRVYAHAK